MSAAASARGVWRRRPFLYPACSHVEPAPLEPAPSPLKPTWPTETRRALASARHKTCHKRNKKRGAAPKPGRPKENVHRPNGREERRRPGELEVLGGGAITTERCKARRQPTTADEQFLCPFRRELRLSSQVLRRGFSELRLSPRVLRRGWFSELRLSSQNSRLSLRVLRHGSCP